jgi:hypothetical protein
MRKPLRASLPPRPNQAGLLLLDKLSARERKLLEGLGRAHGADTIAAAVRVLLMSTPKRGRGRPSSWLSKKNKMHIADYIESQAEEHRLAGSSRPYKEAYSDFHKLYFGKVAVSDSSLRTIERYHRQGRRYLRQLKRSAG